MTYAIIQIGGKQFWVQAGRFYDVNKINASPGETVLLHKVLLLKKNGEMQVGFPCISTVSIKAKVLKHFKSRKITVFKMKPKKNMKSKRGYRQDLTRLFIQEI
uniref:Large ribosomal subunit protein bL21c n=1 Tax=Calliarthron tuberculosum TaxID=48942 RepID=M4IV51_CALTB|nr:50S ribosomal protein L21 [Calliarthron tuberculosum]AGA63752.1 50S ribosomal protein L21 [Calliarthron tuberculosum]